MPKPLIFGLKSLYGVWNRISEVRVHFHRLILLLKSTIDKELFKKRKSRNQVVHQLGRPDNARFFQIDFLRHSLS